MSIDAIANGCPEAAGVGGEALEVASVAASMWADTPSGDLDM